MFYRLAKNFGNLAGFILLAIAAMSLVGNVGKLIIQPSDPIFGVSSRYLFWVLAGFELAAAVICLFGNSRSFQNLVVFWLTSNLLIYRLFLFYSGVKTIRAYYDTMAYSFGVSASALNILFGTGIIFLWLGSGLSLFLLRKESKREASAAQTQTNIVQA